MPALTIGTTMNETPMAVHGLELSEQQRRKNIEAGGDESDGASRGNDSDSDATSFSVSSSSSSSTAREAAQEIDWKVPGGEERGGVRKRTNDSETTATASTEGTGERAGAGTQVKTVPGTDMASLLREHVTFLPWHSVVVWPLMWTVPLLMTIERSPLHYAKIFREEWYEFDPTPGVSPSPLGLSLGILAVVVGQLGVLVTFYCYKYLMGKEPMSVQKKGARLYEFGEGVTTHLVQLEGFGLLGGYLSITWMLRIMPDSYYAFDGGIEWHKVFLCLAIQDGIQYAMHRFEHDASPRFYRWSHKPHHRFTNPRLFDAFNGSVPDTVCMILVPLVCTAQVMSTVNVWTYMAFGSAYANWLTLIHSEYVFPWDNRLFRPLGFGTPADHHVHHAANRYNFGHLFMWFDWACGTYKDPKELPKVFNEEQRTAALVKG